MRTNLMYDFGPEPELEIVELEVINTAPPGGDDDEGPTPVPGMG